MSQELTKQTRVFSLPIKGQLSFYRGTGSSTEHKWIDSVTQRLDLHNCPSEAIYEENTTQEAGPTITTLLSSPGDKLSESVIFCTVKGNGLQRKPEKTKHTSQSGDLRPSPVYTIRDLDGWEALPVLKMKILLYHIALQPVWDEKKTEKRKKNINNNAYQY